MPSQKDSWCDYCPGEPCETSPVDQTQPPQPPTSLVPAGSWSNLVILPRDGTWSVPPAGYNSGGLQGIGNGNAQPPTLPTLPSWLVLVGLGVFVWWANRD
jgi:hypothetical protein